MPCHWSPEISICSSPALPLKKVPRGPPSAFSKLSKPSSLRCSSCPWGLTPSWLPPPDTVQQSDVLLVQRHPKLHTGPELRLHQCIADQDSQLPRAAGDAVHWMQMHPRTQLTLFVDPYSTFHQAGPPDSFLWGCRPDFCPLCAYKLGYPPQIENPALVLLRSLAVVQLASLSNVSVRPLCPRETSVFFQLQSCACSGTAADGRGVTVPLDGNPVSHKCALTFPHSLSWGGESGGKQKNKTRGLR